mgnify:CR=1 FL=1
MKLAEGRLYWLLNSWVKRHPLGVWCLSHTGVGALTAATLLTEVDLDKCPSVLSLWRFSGLDPTCPKRGEGGKPRWNRKLRASCWSLGESFVRSKGNPDCYYGGVYAARRAEEQARSDSGALSDVAKATLATKRYRDSTEAYKHYTAGKLPPARLHARATRYAVKLFLSTIGRLPTFSVTVHHRHSLVIGVSTSEYPIYPWFPERKRRSLSGFDPLTRDFFCGSFPG